MRQIQYSKDEISLLQSMKYRHVNQLFDGGHFNVTFVFEDHHISAEPICKEPASQHQCAEAIVIGFEKSLSKFQPNETHDLLSENCKIERLWIARTVLYFSDFKTDVSGNSGKVYTEYLDPKVSEIIRKTESQAVGSYDVCIEHPSSAKNNSKIRPEYSNLVDAGVLFKIDDHMLACLSRINSYGIFDPWFQASDLGKICELKDKDDFESFEFFEI